MTILRSSETPLLVGLSALSFSCASLFWLASRWLSLLLLGASIVLLSPWGLVYRFERVLIVDFIKHNCAFLVAFICIVDHSFYSTSSMREVR